jgi:hypothetical protein
VRQLWTTLPRYIAIEEKTGAGLVVGALQEGFCRLERLHGETGRPEETGESLAYHRIIVNDTNHRVGFRQVQALQGTLPLTRVP